MEELDHEIKQHMMGGLIALSKKTPALGRTSSEETFGVFGHCRLKKKKKRN